MNHCFLKLLTLSLLLLLTRQTQAQQATPTRFTHADSLRGSLRPERTCYDVRFYDLSLSVDPTSQTIQGSNTIRYSVKEPFTRMQVDLFANMQVKSITQNGKPLQYKRDANAIFITIPNKQAVGQTGEITITYAGSPQAAKNPPWDGGFVWRRDTVNNKPWVTVACEGTGASLWWPCKDHLSDEPDSVRIRVRVPKGLTCVSNGSLQGQRPVGTNQTEWTWFVHYPINNYNVTLNITDYAHLSDEYRSADGQALKLDYYVLPFNVSKAKPHFEQVKGMLNCYEKHFGKFPFWRDGYKLVETPYWGMEHQSAIAYGNKYKNNPYNFDFIIIHESGHEYFGNSLSCADHAEMWIHESFTTYAEALYMECTQGAVKAQAYLNMQRPKIKNEYAMLGPLGVNADQKDTDIYYKGSWMLHTIRHMVNNDALWFKAIRSLATEKRLSIVGTDEVVDFLAQRTGVNLKPITDQYLHYARLPTFEYQVVAKNGQDHELRHRWVADVDAFSLPVKVRIGSGEEQVLYPTRAWTTTKLKAATGTVSVNTDRGLFAVRQTQIE